MKDIVFVDTGFWIALFDAQDQHHEKVKTNLKSIIKEYRLCLSEFITFEAITYLNCSAKKHDLALEFLNKIESNGSITVFEVDNNIKNKALAIFKKYKDQYFSFTDCTSFAIMREQKVIRYAGFDIHFRSMGFHPIM